MKLARSRFSTCCCGWPFGSAELQTIDDRRRARSGGWCRRGLSGHLSTLTLFGLFVSAVGARYAFGCSEMSADRTPGY